MTKTILQWTLHFVAGKNKLPNSHHCTWEVMGTVPWHLCRLLWENEGRRWWKSVCCWIGQRTWHKMRSVSGLENQLWTGNKHRDLTLAEVRCTVNVAWLQDDCTLCLLAALRCVPSSILYVAELDVLCSTLMLFSFWF